MGPQRDTHNWVTNTFILQRSKCLLILWVQSPPKVILEPKKMKLDTCFHICPYISHEMIGQDAMLFVFWMLRFKPAFLVSSFTFIKRLFRSFSLSAIKVVSPAHLIVDIFTGNLDSSWCFIQLGISHDVVCLLFRHSVVPNILWPCGLQHTRLHYLSPSPGTCSDSRPLNRWCHLHILSSIGPFSFSLLFFPAWGSFPTGWLFA